MVQQSLLELEVKVFEDLEELEVDESEPDRLVWIQLAEALHATGEQIGCVVVDRHLAEPLVHPGHSVARRGTPKCAGVGLNLPSQVA